MRCARQPHRCQRTFGGACTGAGTCGTRVEGGHRSAGAQLELDALRFEQRLHVSPYLHAQYPLKGRRFHAKHRDICALLHGHEVGCCLHADEGAADNDDRGCHALCPHCRCDGGRVLDDSQGEDVAQVRPWRHERLRGTKDAGRATCGDQQFVVCDALGGGEGDGAGARIDGRHGDTRAQGDARRREDVRLAQCDVVGCNCHVLAQLGPVVRQRGLGRQQGDDARETMRAQRLCGGHTSGAGADDDESAGIGGGGRGKGWREAARRHFRLRQHHVNRVGLRVRLCCVGRQFVEHRAVLNVARAHVEAGAVPGAHYAVTRQDTGR